MNGQYLIFMIVMILWAITWQTHKQSAYAVQIIASSLHSSTRIRTSTLEQTHSSPAYNL